MFGGIAHKSLVGIVCLLGCRYIWSIYLVAIVNCQIDYSDPQTHSETATTTANIVILSYCAIDQCVITAAGAAAAASNDNNGIELKLFDMLSQRVASGYATSGVIYALTKPHLASPPTNRVRPSFGARCRCFCCFCFYDHADAANSWIGHCFSAR